MGLLSILPASFAVVETWITRLFLFIGALIIGPWVALLLYDLVLYILRAVSYEIPVIGGRARGKARPRAPSLTERPSGHRRKFSLARRERPTLSTGAIKDDLQDTRYRRLAEEQEDSSSAS
ncbi:hypothetical protein IAQ61_002668 [Plenodomus lingam]|uniref:uncharacterized protein n=1 Tax=Leptosphaeria maculans TaxID=5022 RepID=UPI003320F4A2|nr:hypothetical protein IAQ61_002668 [Plenodomus lingam]